VLHFLHFLHFGAQTLINIGFKSAKKVQKVQRLAFWGKTLPACLLRYAKHTPAHPAGNGRRTTKKAPAAGQGFNRQCSDKAAPQGFPQGAGMISTNRMGKYKMTMKAIDLN